MKIKSVHFQAAAFAVIYYVLSGLLFVRFVTLQNIYISFLAAVAFGIISGIVFLYFFIHKDFFPFMKKFEKEEAKTEKGYLARFTHYGKILACVAISEVGGPIFLALSVRFLFSKSHKRYLIVIFCTIISTVFAVALARGLLSFLW